MLRALRISNLAIIDSLHLELVAGFSVLSGETGAGKSILIDALGLVLGDRADSMQVRAGEERAEISAEFSLDAALEARTWLRDHAMEDPDEPGTCLLRRTVTADGRSRAFINGAAATLGNLRDLGERLVEIHGQNEHQSLLRTDAQRQILDGFSGQPEVLSAVVDAARRFSDIESAIERLRTEASRDPAQIEFVRHQLNELEGLNLREGEVGELDLEYKRLANAGRLIQEGNSAQETLYGGENSLHDQIGMVLHTLRELAEIDPSFADAERTLGEAQVQLRESADTVTRSLDRLDLDPDRLAELESRVTALHDLARKHRVRPEQLGERLEALRQELQECEGAAEKLEQLTAEREQAISQYGEAATRLSAVRRKAAKSMSSKVTAVVRELGMPQAVFSVLVESRDDEKPRLSGSDEVRFDFTANPGQPARPLGKVASGGELSRVSLAIQLVANQSRSSATLIFDEVDAGIGGGTAETVGAKLRELAARRQVLSVTHLPQVAAQADQQYGIRKEVKSGKTLTRVTLLDREARIAELARMLGGKKITASTEAHAREMLQSPRKSA